MKSFWQSARKLWDFDINAQKGITWHTEYNRLCYSVLWQGHTGTTQKRHRHSLDVHFLSTHCGLLLESENLCCFLSDYSHVTFYIWVFVCLHCFYVGLHNINTQRDFNDSEFAAWISAGPVSDHMLVPEGNGVFSDICFRHCLQDY